MTTNVRKFNFYSEEKGSTSIVIYYMLGRKFIAVYLTDTSSTLYMGSYRGEGSTPREAIRELRLDYKLQTDSKFRETWTRINGADKRYVEPKPRKIRRHTVFSKIGESDE